MTTLFSEARDLHMQQFAAFVASSREGCQDGSSEVRLTLGAGSKCLERFYCADFVCNDDTPQILEMKPAQTLPIAEKTARICGLAASFDALVWDDLIIAHDADRFGEDDVAPWFLRWCDPDGVRPPETGPFSRLAHAIILEPGEIWVDLGTAPTDAAPELLAALRDAGATQVRLSGSR